MSNRKLFVVLGVLALAIVVVITGLNYFGVLDKLADFEKDSLSQLGSRVESKDYWEVQITQTLDRRFVEEMGGSDRFAGSLMEQIRSNLSPKFAEQMEFSVKPGEKTEKGITFTILLVGRDPAIIAPVFFDDLYEVVDLLAGPVTLNLSGAVKVGTPLHLNLLTVPSTGASWFQMEKGEVASLNSERFWADWEAYYGSPEVQSMEYVFNVSGDVRFIINYNRPWENLESWQTTLIIVSQPEMIRIFDLTPNEPNFGDVVPNAVAEYETEYKWDEGIKIPETFDWTTTDNHFGRAMNLVIGDQGACGSCWSFATTGLAEGALQVQSGMTSYDLSEQYLLSCNTYYKNCGGGNAYWALEYYIDKNARENNPPGAVLDADMPYSPWNFVCSTIQNHPIKLVSRHYVVDDITTGDSLAQVDVLKQAIRLYGPIAVAVCGSGEFKTYTAGVFDADNCQRLNHQVLLVGWDNKTETWKLKNSWGTNWGENGYMWIKWGTNRIGYEPIYAVAP